MGYCWTLVCIGAGGGGVHTTVPVLQAVTPLLVTMLPESLPGIDATDGVGAVVFTGFNANA